MEKEIEKSELQRRVELINKLWKYRPKIQVENRMIRDDVWMDVLDMAIKSKEYNQKE